VEEFLKVQRENRGPGTVGWWEQVIAQLEPGRVDDLMEAARSREIAHRTIATVLGQWGFDVTVAQVGHWRRNHVR